MDNTLQKSWGELYERALSIEIFIKEATTYQIIREEAARIFEYYIRLMFMGVAGTPVFDDDGNFHADVRNTYMEFEMLYPDTTVSGLIREYFSYLESINFHIDFESVEANKAFSDICSYLVSEAGKRVLQ